MSRSPSQGGQQNLVFEWAKPGVPVWLEVRDNTNTEVYEYLPCIVRESFPARSMIKIVLTSDNSEKDVQASLVHQRSLEHNKVTDLAEIPILNDAELLRHLQVLYNQDEIYCYCGPSLIAINPYKPVPHTVSPDTLDLVMRKLQQKRLNEAPPHAWTISAMAYKALNSSNENQAICVNGESGAGKTESTKKCLDFITKIKIGNVGNESDDLADKILACNPVLEAFGNSKTVRNDNSSRFGKYVKLFFDPTQSYRLLGASVENYLLEKSRVVSLAKDERGFHIFYAVCRFMPLEMQKTYKLSKNGQPCDLSYFKILRGSGIYETPKVNDEEFYTEVANAFDTLEFSDEEQDAIWRLISIVLHMGNFLVDDSRYEEGKTPCSIVTNDDFKTVVQLMQCDPKELQDALTLRLRVVQNQVIKTPHRPENVVDFYLAMIKDLYSNMFNWIVKKVNVSLVGFLPQTRDHSVLRTIGLLDIFGFEIFDKNYIEQLFINYTNERLQGLYIDHIFKNECDIFRAEGLEKYIGLITYKDNLALIKVLDSSSNPPGIFSLANQSSRLNQKDDQLMSEIKKLYGKEPHPYLSFHKIKQNIFYVKHTARDVEYTSDTFVEKNKDEISPGIIKTIENSLPTIHRIFKGVVGNQMNYDEPPAVNPNAKFLAFKFCQNINLLMDELHKCECHFIRCVKPNEIKKPDTWVGYLALKQITYMGLLDSLKVRKYNYPIRFKYAAFYKIYQDIDLNKEGSISFDVLVSNNENFRKLTENLLSAVGIPWSNNDLLLGKTKIFINEGFKFKLDEVLKIKQKAKREALALLTEFYRGQRKRAKVKEYFERIGKCIALARGTLSSVNAKIEYVHFKRHLQLIRKFQYNFRITNHYRTIALRQNKMKLIAKVCKLKLFQQNMLKILRAKRAMDFAGAMITAKVYRKRRDFCAKIARGIFDKAWGDIKKRYAEGTALTIQRHFRSHIARKKYANAITTLENKVKNHVIESNLVKIQASVKGFLVRSRFLRLQDSARTIQSFFRTHWLRTYFLRLRNATIKIQRAFRRFNVRKEAITERMEGFLQKANNLKHLNVREYENLLGSLPAELKSGNLVDYEYARWAKRINSADATFQQFLPSSPEVELTPKAKLFSVPFDLSLGSETIEAYPGTWSGELKSLLHRLNERKERLLHVSVGDSFTTCLSDELKLYAFGANDVGQLCSQDFRPSFAGRSREIINLSKNPLLQMSLGQDGGAGVSQSGRVFFWGNLNPLQSFGRNRKNKNSLLVQNLIKEESVSVGVRGSFTKSGEDVNYVVGKSGKVYVVGSEISQQDMLHANGKRFPSSGTQRRNVSEREMNFELDYLEQQYFPDNTKPNRANNQSPKPLSKIYVSTLAIEDSQTPENLSKSRSTSQMNKRNKEAPVSPTNALQISPKIVHVNCGLSFSMFLSDKGVLFSSGENNHGELGLGDNVPRYSPVIIPLFRKNHEKVDEVSCGCKHVVCRTNLGRVYLWGLGASYQNGDSRAKDTSTPQELSVLESSFSSLAKPKSVQAGSFSSYFFFDDGSLYMLGKCGPGVLSSPAKIPYSTRMFAGKMKEEFVPVKIVSTWSSMISLTYLVFLDFRDMETAKNYKEKIAGLLSSKWQTGNVLPNYDENLYKYVQSKNFLREKPLSMFIDVRFSGTSGGKVRSSRHASDDDEFSFEGNVHQEDTRNESGFLNKNDEEISKLMNFGQSIAKKSTNNKIKGTGNFTQTELRKTSKDLTQSKHVQFQNQRAAATSPNFINGANPENFFGQSEAEELKKRLAELKNANDNNFHRAKVSKPPVIAPPRGGYKEDKLRVKVLKVDDNQQVVDTENATIAQRAYNKIASDKVVKKDAGFLAMNLNQKESQLNKIEPISKISDKARKTSKSRDRIESIAANRSKSKSKPSANDFKELMDQFEDSSQTSKPGKNIFTNPLDDYSHVTPSGTKSRANQDVGRDSMKNFSHVITSQKTSQAQLAQSKKYSQAGVNQAAKPKEVWQPQTQSMSAKVAKNLSPMLRRDPTPTKSPRLGGKNDGFDDSKSKEGLFSKLSSKNDPANQHNNTLRKSIASSQASQSKKLNDSKPFLNETIYEEVEKIMKKDPSKWSSIEKQIMSSYVKATKNLGR